ncbi:MAG: hypothetical protein IPH71_16230 [Proteobacteria bacterium]|nr:hypothetical protein [Pseudomonadota bacterium]
MFGNGLLESVSQKTPQAVRDAQPAAVRGDLLARLGWQAEVANIADQSAYAGAREMGVTSLWDKRRMTARPNSPNAARHPMVASWKCRASTSPLCRRPTVTRAGGAGSGRGATRARPVAARTTGGRYWLRPPPAAASAGNAGQAARHASMPSTDLLRHDMGEELA